MLSKEQFVMLKNMMFKKFILIAKPLYFIISAKKEHKRLLIDKIGNIALI